MFPDGRCGIIVSVPDHCLPFYFPLLRNDLQVLIPVCVCVCVCVCLFVSRFYGPVNPMGSCRARSVYLTTRLLGRLSPQSVLLCTFFRQKLTPALLESAEGRK